MPIDWERALERAEELKAQGYSDSQVSAVLDQEAVAADRVAQQYGHESAAGARSSLQKARGALNADSHSPGSEPTADPYESAFQAARASGGRRGDDRYVQAGLEKLFEAAQAGDARVASNGVPDRQTLDRWGADARERLARNRGEQQWSGRQR